MNSNVVSIDEACYQLEKMFVDHGLISHGLAVKLLQSLAYLPSTNSSIV